MAEKSPDQKKYIVLFDGTCKLCNNVVGFISKNDKRKLFCFVPLESEKAKDYSSVSGEKYLKRGSLLLIGEGKLYTKSNAVLHILRHMDRAWPLLYAFILIPAFIRDPIYDIIAKYRYRWFGSCLDCPEPRSC